jgi:hypothetical protein
MVSSKELNRSRTSVTTKIRLGNEEIDSVRDKLMISVRRRMPSSSFKPFERAMKYSLHTRPRTESGLHPTSDSISSPLRKMNSTVSDNKLFQQNDKQQED